MEVRAFRCTMGLATRVVCVCSVALVVGLGGSGDVNDEDAVGTVADVGNIAEDDHQNDLRVNPLTQVWKYMPTEAKYEQLIQDKLIPIIGSEEHIGLWYYPRVKERLNSDVVPVLREMLMDKTYRNRWGMIANMIAWLSEENDVDSVNALLEYIRRPDIWNHEEIPFPFDPYYQKVSVLVDLGLFRVISSTQALRAAFTLEGAERLVESWIDDQTYLEKGYGAKQISDVRGFGAAGQGRVF